MTETITIRVTATTKEALQALAEADKRKLSAFITIALEELVERAKTKPKRGKQ